MNNTNNNEIKVGLLTFFGILVLTTFIYFAKGINLTGKDVDVIFEFENSGGISAGAPVVVSGVKRGSVTNISLANGKAYIFATINKYDDLYYDATAVISILELTGGKKIEISSGVSPKQFNPNTDTIKGTTTADLATLITSISGVTGNLTSIVVKLDNVITSIDKLTSDTIVMNNLRDIVSNTEAATKDLSVLVADNKQLVNATLQDIATLTKDLKVAVADNKPEVEKIISELSVAMNKINKLANKADITFSSADTLLTNINDIIFDIKSNNGGTISKFIYDKNFAAKLDTLIISADTLFKNISKYGINTNVRLGRRP